MKILAIDDCEITLESLHAYLDQEIPGVEVTEYPSEALGKPQPDFDWTVYDALLLDYDLGNGQTGVDWLKEFGSQAGFPRTILITGVEDPYVVANAIKVGAEGYLNKADLTPKRLAAVVREVLAEPPPDEVPKEPSTEPPSEVEDLARKFERERAARAGSNDDSGYRLLRVIGRGMGCAVYLGERLEDGTTVAVKLLDRSFANDAETVQRFIREGQIVSRLNSRYVVKVYDQGFTSSYGYIAMEFFGRGDLKQRIEYGISPNDALIYLHNIACGIEAIHAAGIVHRDLKPSNIMFRADGSMALADFGISKRLGAGPDLTRFGTIIGTPHYMSPEQAEGLPADMRSDLYSAGVMLYEMLTGTRPYTGDTVSALMFQHMHAKIPTLEGDLARYQYLLDRLLAKDPEDRFQSVSILLEVLSGMAA